MSKYTIKAKRTRHVVVTDEVVFEVDLPSDAESVRRHYAAHLPAGTVELPPGTAWQETGRKVLTLDIDLSVTSGSD